MNPDLKELGVQLQRSVIFVEETHPPHFPAPGAQGNGEEEFRIRGYKYAAPLGLEVLPGLCQNNRLAKLAKLAKLASFPLFTNRTSEAEVRKSRPFSATMRNNYEGGCISDNFEDVKDHNLSF